MNFKEIKSPSSDFIEMATIANASFEKDEDAYFFAAEALGVAKILYSKTLASSLSKIAMDQLLKIAQTNPKAHAKTRAHPYYRLDLVSRILLSLQYVENSNYAQMGNWLGLNPVEAESALWKARLELGTEASLGLLIGPSLKGADCPQYDQQRPWTARFLDNQCSAAERLFLQNHLLQCSECNKALQRCRKFVYELGLWIPLKERVQMIEDFLKRENVLTQSWLRPANRTYRENIIIFLSRPEIKAAIFVLVGILIMHFLYK